jgi:DNA helicase IV
MPQDADARTASPGPSTALASEQAVVDALYARLDELRSRVASDLEQVRRARAIGTHQSRSERDAYATLYEDRSAQLRAVEERLCFGRLDHSDGDTHYIGRIGLADTDGQRMLIDWRAEAAMPFYQATAARPLDVVRRRHLLTRGRTVTSVEDEVFDLDALPDDAELAGEGALLAAVNAQRTGRMGDIVSTIQAEQDAIIRSPLEGVLVVEGGPGTGKTAVALHRAAYLLYSHRERLAGSGVLVVGPSPVVLRYLEQVLPSLGETGVVMVTPGRLLPGVNATVHDPAPVAAVKGDLRMAGAVARAVRDRQRVPSEPVEIVIDGRTLVMTPAMVRSARDRARRTGRPHNLARTTFAKDLLNQLAGQLAARLGGLDGADRADLVADLRDSRQVRREINLCWMPLTAARVISRLLADPDRLRHAAGWLTEEQIALLVRDVEAPFTIDDVPLLDEAAELIGHDDSAAAAEAARAAAQRRRDTEYARDVLAMTGAGALVSADRLADAWTQGEEHLTLAERAAGDRSWAYGHVVVDEAQELSPMMWRVLGRRNPSRSMTVVGDLAQTHAAAGARSWRQVLSPLVQDRWRSAALTVSYRTPAAIMQVAAQAVAGTGVSVPRSVRDGRWPPRAVEVGPGELGPGVEAAVSTQLADLQGGRVAVICLAEQVAPLAQRLRQRFGADVGTGWAALDRAVAVVAVDDAKGLEFDGVVVVEPRDIAEANPRGRNDLYVALTRPTQQLHLVHSRDLPTAMTGLTTVA